MKKTIKPILFICLCILCIVLVLIALLGVRNDSIYKKEAEDKLYYANSSYANEFNQLFVDMETLVNSLSVDVKYLFRYKDYNDDLEVYNTKKSELDHHMKEMLQLDENASGLYFSFNPKIHEGRQEIYYIRDNDGKVRYVDSAAIAPSWFIEGNPNVDYYYKAIEDGQFWGGLQWESSISQYVGSHSLPLYDEDHVLLGVVGADILMSNVTSTVENMNIYRDGETYLIDSNYKIIAQNTDNNDTNHIVSAIKENNQNKDNPRVTYIRDKKNNEFLLTSMKLKNNWYLAMIQPEAVVYQPLNSYKIISYLLAAFSIIALIIIIILVFRKSIFPVYKQLEDQEIYIMNKDRQAELGEMIGNIAHQWKQPVNAMNISLLNIKDDLKSEEFDKVTVMNHVETIQKSIDSLSPTMDDFINYLKPVNRKELFTVNYEIRKSIGLIDGKLKINRVTYQLNSDQEYIVSGYVNEFCQCIINIVNNGVDAIVDFDSSKRTIGIDVKSSSGRIYIEITNSGPFIPPEIGKNIFKPYFTTKEKKGGTGVGLYLAERILVEHFDGKLWYRNSRDGVTFIMELNEYKKGKE